MDKIFKNTYNLFIFLRKSLFLVKYFIDSLLIVTSYWFSYYIRFETNIPDIEFILFKDTVLIFFVSFIICDIFLGLTKGVWKYTSLRDIERIVFFVLAGNGLTILLGMIFLNTKMVNIPRSIYLINSFLLFLFISGIRLFYRIIFDKFHRLFKKSENVLIIGDGDSSVSLQYSILKDYAHQFRIVGFVSLNKERLGETINAIPIIGSVSDIPSLVKRKNVKYIFIALDKASNEQMKNIIKISYDSKAEVRIVPSIFELVDKNIALKDLRQVKFEDYLGREPVKFDIEKIKKTFFKKNILITGGGGSIGSSICKELIKFSPDKLIVLDISENNLFRISTELNEISKNLNIKDIQLIYKIIDIRNDLYLEELLKKYSIDYFIHTAALKHLPFCEDNIKETISINVYGSLIAMKIAIKAKVKKFIYISTDKAVEPTSVMGATKRIGELLIKSFSKDNIDTKFIAVRFGNVIGSCGNVVEIFTHQLQNNQPLTITSMDMARFFMSLDEAVKLILEAISIGVGGEIFVLDMGSLIKIKDLASDMALFYGKKIKDSDFIIIGKRKGEKTYEKLFSDSEIKVPTSVNKIFRVEEDISVENLIEKINNLVDNIYKYSEEDLYKRLFSIVK